eukprot:556195_1
MKDRTSSSTHGKGRRIASQTLSNKYTSSSSSKSKYKSSRSSFIYNTCINNTNIRIICTIIIAIFIIISLLWMLYIDNKSHLHFNPNETQPINQQPSQDNTLISIEELNTTNYINTARTRNNISPKILRSIIANTADDIHIVFSTGCSEYQNWQSEVLLYSWARLNHPGQITRLVSGCKNLDEKKSALKTAIISERVHLFYAPDYTPPQHGAGHPFHYFNKPFSMRKFLTEIDIAENIIVLIDPDMIITKIFKYHLPSSDIDEKYHVYKGHPVSQKYGIGAKWVPWKLCKTETCLKIDDRIAWEHYSVGPPYMMHIDDWRLIANEWVSYSAPALEKDPPPSILAEMYSYAIACAHHGLPHELINSMLSDPEAIESEPNWKQIEWDFKQLNYDINSELGVHILHYCHGYWLGDERNTGHMINYGFNFHKGHLPKDILHNCDEGLLVEPPTNKFAMDRDVTKGNNNVWMLYQLITRINNALANYKQLYCGDKWIPVFNIVLRQPEADHTNKMHYFLDDL